MFNCRVEQKNKHQRQEVNGRSPGVAGYQVTGDGDKSIISNVVLTESSVIPILLSVRLKIFSPFYRISFSISFPTIEMYFRN